MIEEIVPLFKVIDYRNKKVITPDILEQMRLINTIDNLDPKTYKDLMEENFKDSNFKICLAFRKPGIRSELLGYAYGELTDETFKIDRFMVNPKLQGKNIGTKIFGYFWGYLRHKFEVKTIKMIAYIGTHEINKKLTGQKEITIIKDGKPMAVYRNFNSRFLYSLSSKPIKEKTKAGLTVDKLKTEDRIHINNNPYYRKSRAK